MYGYIYYIKHMDPILEKHLLLLLLYVHNEDASWEMRNKNAKNETHWVGQHNRQQYNLSPNRERV